MELFDPIPLADDADRAAQATPVTDDPETWSPAQYRRVWDADDIDTIDQSIPIPLDDDRDDSPTRS